MKQNKWLIYSGTAFLLWGIWAFFSKLTAGTAGPMLGLLLEIIGTVIIAFVILLMLKFKPEFNFKGVLFSVLSGVFSIAGIFVFLNSLNLGPSIIIVPLSALYPAVTVVLARIFLSEKLHKKQIIGIILAIVASVLLGVV